MSKLFSFPYTEIDQKLPHGDILALWRQATAGDAIPLLIQADEALMEVLGYNQWHGDDAPDYYEYARPYIEELTTEEDMRPLLGEPGATDSASDSGTDPLAVIDMGGRDPLVLARFPVKESWEILKYLPLGNWNECPPPEIFAAFFKAMFDKWQALPVYVNGDTLVMKTGRRPTHEESFDLACQLFAFCGDLLMAYPTIYALADALTKDDYWVFWWD